MKNRKRMAILADRVLTGEELEAQERRCVLVENGRIAGILSPAEYEAVKDTAETMDLGSATLLPGLFDCHDHLALDAGLKGHLGMMELPEEEHLKLARNGLRMDLMSGVTTARCMGDRYFLDIKVRRMIREGLLEGPDLLCCGIGMRSAGGHGYVGMPVTGAAAVSDASATTIAKGADHLKFFVSPGVPVPSPGDEIPCFLSEEEISAVVREAHDAHLPVTAHCIGGAGLDLCVRLGVDVLDHLYSVTPEQVHMLENDFGGWIDLTSGIVLDEGREAFTPPEQNIKMRKARAYSRACLQRVYQSRSVRFTIGTDAYHGMLYKEVEYAVSEGASRLDALKAVTVNAARMTGTDRERGRISAGFLADMIAVRTDPLTEPEALKDVFFVMKNGRIVRYDDGKTAENS